MTEQQGYLWVSDEKKPTEWTKTDQLVNLLYRDWMFGELRSNRIPFGPAHAQRLIPDDEMKERRQACHELAAAHEMLVQERDPAATRERLYESFMSHMNRIPRRNVPKAWYDE